MNISKLWVIVLVSVFLCSCTILTPHIEHNKIDNYAFDNLKNVLIYSDYGLLAPKYNRYIKQHILTSFENTSVSAKYLSERIEYSILKAVKKAKEQGLDHVIVIHNAGLGRGRNAYRKKVQVKVVNVESNDTVYVGMFWMTGQTLNDNSYARELSKSIVAHLQNPD